MGHGGARPGSGKPKGHKSTGTLEKEEARARLRAKVIAALDPLVDAQIENARGLSYLVYRDNKTGKFVTVKSAGLDAAQNENTIEVWEKDPSVQAFTDLMNRALDKPTETVSMDATVNASSELLALLDEGRARVAKARKA